MNEEFERCCTFLAEMMEKYGALVLRDIAVEIQYEPETWCDDAEGKRLRYEAYARRIVSFGKFFAEVYFFATSCLS